MPTSEKVGDGVTKSTYIRSDDLHAFYAEGQTYTSATGKRMMEIATSEMLHWVEHRDGDRTLDACYDGTWLRVSEDNGATWADSGEKSLFDTEITEEQMMPEGFSLDQKSDRLLRFFRGQKADRDCYGYINQGAYRAFYSISGDQGATWCEPIQIVDQREGYDANCWAPVSNMASAGVSWPAESASGWMMGRCWCLLRSTKG